jgi:hypothetical protein
MGLNDRSDRKTISTDNNRIPAGIKDMKTASRFSAFTVDLFRYYHLCFRRKEPVFSGFPKVNRAFYGMRR